MLLVALVAVLSSAAPARAQLDENWTVTVNGQTVRVNANGSFVISNIAAPDQFGADGPGSPPDFLGDDVYYLFAVNTSEGSPRFAYSEPFQITQGESYNIGELTFLNTVPPLPQSIRAVANPTELSVGETSQVTVTGTLSDGSEVDVSTRTSASVYRTSSPGVATVGENGLVTAHSPGAAFITVVNFGAAAVVRVTVNVETVSTTAEGFVQREDGTPVAGADVATSQGGAAVTNAAGFFSIPLVVPVLASVSASATANIEGQVFSGNSVVIPVVADGITDTGITVVREAAAGNRMLFAHPQVPGVDESVVVVVPVDMDGDGDIDLVYHNSDDAFLAFNNGDGTFGTPLVFSLDSGLQGLAVGDFDGDLDPDIALTHWSSGIISIFINNGDQTLSDPLVVAVGGRPVSIATADFDGDTDLDLAVVNQGNVSILMNDGTAVFVENATYDAGNRSEFVVIGDLDGINGPDLAVLDPGPINAGGGIYVLLNDGSGQFGAASVYDQESDLRGLAISDLDRDNDLDLAVTHGFGGVTVWLNPGNGTFPEGTSHDLGGFAEAVVAVDLDGVNGPDLAVTDDRDSTVFVLHNNGDGTYGEAVPHMTGSSLEYIAAGDLDGDGDQDLVGSARSTGLDLLFNLGGGVFPSDVHYQLTAIFSVAAGDWDRDNDLDLAAGAEDGTVFLLFNGGAGTFVGGAPLATAAAADGPTSAGEECRTFVLSDDLNADGDPDLVVISDCGSEVLVRFGLGDGTFAPGVPYTVGLGSSPAAIVDVDGVNGPDLVFSTNTIHVRLNNGQGVFGEPVESDAGTALIRSLAAGNINGDAEGNVDLAIIWGNTPALMLGNGDGTFTEPVEVDTTNRATAIAVGDLDGDGDLDLAVTDGSNGDHVSVFLNSGNGTFAEPDEYPVGDGSVAISIGDVSGDDLPDVIVANRWSSSISVLINQGGGVFASERQYATDTSLRDLTMADFDGDGDIDMAVAGGNRNGGSVSVLLNRLVPPDCNDNGTVDEIDVATGASPDCNENRVPDACDADCNNNQTPDDCDIANGTADDSNNNGLPDECETD